MEDAQDLPRNSMRIMYMVSAVVLFVLPVRAAQEMAGVTDACTRLRFFLNKRRRWWQRQTGISEEMQAAALQRIVNLERSMAKLNNGQGLGFLVFGMLMNKKLLAKAQGALTPLVLSLIPTILELTKPVDNTLCGPSVSALQRDALAAVVAQFNQSCSYNISVVGGVLQAVTMT